MDRSMIVTGAHETVKRERALAMRRGMTPAEEALWERLRQNRLAGLHFRRQQIIDGFIADFYCHRAGLVVEVDGDVHHTRAAYDADRDAVIATRGLRLPRFANEQVTDHMDDVLAAIVEACLDAAGP